MGWAPPGRYWWRWAVPGHHEDLNLNTEDLNVLSHRVRDEIRHVVLRQLEARCPHTFGGLAGTINSWACTTWLEQFSGEIALSMLRGLLTGAMWTASTAGAAHMCVPTTEGRQSSGGAHTD